MCPTGSGRRISCSKPLTRDSSFSSSKSRRFMTAGAIWSRRAASLSLRLAAKISSLCDLRVSMIRRSASFLISSFDEARSGAVSFIWVTSFRTDMVSPFGFIIYYDNCLFRGGQEIVFPFYFPYNNSIISRGRSRGIFWINCG